MKGRQRVGAVEDAEYRGPVGHVCEAAGGRGGRRGIVELFIAGFGEIGEGERGGAGCCAAEDVSMRGNADTNAASIPVTVALPS